MPVFAVKGAHEPGWNDVPVPLWFDVREIRVDTA